MKTDSHKNRTVSGTEEIQYLSSSDYIKTVFYNGVVVLNINSIFTEGVLYFTVIKKLIYSLLTLATTEQWHPFCTSAEQQAITTVST
jgi:hypothetical protein